MNRTKTHKIITAIMIAAVSLTASFAILAASSAAGLKADVVWAARVDTLPDAVTRGIKKESIRQRVIRSIKERLEKFPVHITGQVKRGKLAAPVTRDMMYEEIIKATGIAVVKSDLPNSFNAWGLYSVDVKIYDNVYASVRIHILPPDEYLGPLVYPNAKVEDVIFKRRFWRLRGEGKSAYEACRIINLNSIPEKRKKENAAEFHEEMELLKAKQKKADLENKHVKVYVRVGVNGKIIGTVSHREIADAIERTYGIIVDKKTIEPRNLECKTLGTYDISVVLREEVSSSMKVEVLKADG